MVETTSQLLNINSENLFTERVNAYKDRYAGVAGDLINIPVRYLQDEQIISPTNFNNLQKAVVEHAKLLAGGKIEYRQDAYTTNWEIPELEAVYNEGISSKQIPEDELYRNTLNRSFYEKVKATRSAGDFTSTMVEFSPSPQLTPAMLNRGYRGYHNISLWEYDPTTNSEKVTIYWLRRELDTQHHNPLLAFRDLAVALDNTLQGENAEINAIASSDSPTDLDIMTISGAFSGAALGNINEFISHYAMPNIAPQFEHMVAQKIDPLVQSLFEQVHKTAGLILDDLEAGNQHINPFILAALEQLNTQRAFLEANTLIQLDKLAGTDYAGLQKQNISVTPVELAKMDADQQLRFLGRINFVSVYCGGMTQFGDTDKDNVFGSGGSASVSLFKVMSMLKSGGKIVVCPSCSTTICYPGNYGECYIGYSCCQPLFDAGILR